MHMSTAIICIIFKDMIRFGMVINVLIFPIIIKLERLKPARASAEETITVLQSATAKCTMLVSSELVEVKSQSQNGSMQTTGASL